MKLLKKILRKLLKIVLVIVLIPVVYILIGLILGSISVNSNQDESQLTEEIYIGSSGVHVDIVLPKELISVELFKGLKDDEGYDYYAIGWGEENFFLNTPTWGDLTFKNAFTAAFLKSSTLMHVSRNKKVKDHWIPVKISKKQLNQLNEYMLNSFTLKDNEKIIIEGASYWKYDNFYKAEGNYTLFTTCNTWANAALKESGIKACLWTPFDFLILNKHRE